MTPKFIKNLLLVSVVNTVLFCIASSIRIPIWTVLTTEIFMFIGWFMIKAWFDPAHQLVVQGSHMGWEAAGTVRDESGLRDTLLRRDDMVVRISYKEKALYLLEPWTDGPYSDFLELERSLAI